MKILLLLIGISALFAIPAILLPFSWMQAIHATLGLGAMPEGPVVAYLARSLSAFYAAIGAMCIFVAFDVRRYRPLIGLWGWLAIVMGCTLIGIAVTAPLPLYWTLGEGPPTILVGAILVWWARHARRGETSEPAPN